MCIFRHYVLVDRNLEENQETELGATRNQENNSSSVIDAQDPDVMYLNSVLEYFVSPNQLALPVEDQYTVVKTNSVNGGVFNSFNHDHLSEPNPQCERNVPPVGVGVSNFIPHTPVPNTAPQPPSSASVTSSDLNRNNVIGGEQQTPARDHQLQEVNKSNTGQSEATARHDVTPTHASVHTSAANQLPVSMSVVICGICKEQFASIPECQAHARNLHKSSDEQVRSYACPVCKTDQPSLEALTRHVTSEHRVALQLRFKCFRCGAVYPSPVELERHECRGAQPIVVGDD